MVKRLSIWFSSFILALTFAFSATASAPAKFTRPELDAILAPIALYPDGLLMQMLIASTYPLDVQEARRLLDHYPSLQHSGGMLSNEVLAMPWDDGVKALTQFPAVLAMLDDQPEWENALGYAVVHQRADVLRTVQRLRYRAYRTSFLKSGDRQAVVIHAGIIEIQPPHDNYLYVPYYDPNVVYGKWWWPNRPPFYWEPPQRYRPADYALKNGFFFGPLVGMISSIYIPVRADWRRYNIVIAGGTKPGTHWQWTPHPPRKSRSKRPNHPPETKPVLKSVAAVGKGH